MYHPRRKGKVECARGGDEPDPPEDVTPKKGNKRKTVSNKYRIRPSFSDLSKSDEDSDAEDVFISKKFKKGKNSSKKKDDKSDHLVDFTPKKGKKCKGSSKKKGGTNSESEAEEVFVPKKSKKGKNSYNKKDEG